VEYPELAEKTRAPAGGSDGARTGAKLRT
jgi:hypothetical protein